MKNLTYLRALQCSTDPATRPRPRACRDRKGISDSTTGPSFSPPRSSDDFMKRVASQPEVATLFIAASEGDSNLYLCPTRFDRPGCSSYYLEVKGEPLLSDLEMDRAKTQASVDRVLSYSEVEKKAENTRHQGAPTPLTSSMSSRRMLQDPSASGTGQFPVHLCDTHCKNSAIASSQNGIPFIAARHQDGQKSAAPY